MQKWECKSPGHIEVIELAVYNQPTYNKLVHSATTCSTTSNHNHKCNPQVVANIFKIRNVEITHVTMTTPT